MESTVTISTSPSRRATSTAIADLPVAVGPTRTRWARSGAGDRDAHLQSGRRGVPGRRRHLDQLAVEVVGVGPGDDHVGEGPGPEDGAVPAGIGRGAEVDQLVLPRAPGQNIGVLAAGTLDEHLLAAPEASV